MQKYLLFPYYTYERKHYISYSRADCRYSNERNFHRTSSNFSVVYFQFSFLHSALTASQKE